MRVFLNKLVHLLANSISLKLANYSNLFDQFSTHFNSMDFTPSVINICTGFTLSCACAQKGEHESLCICTLSTVVSLPDFVHCEQYSTRNPLAPGRCQPPCPVKGPGSGTQRAHRDLPAW
ncbi:hypothetical protein fugu_019357 [Takifugu bimaculatus]|uniref:Uncharacterized protein n=1 Tax=Takifugu bimaculatus TaxID=433685 RepID=A0A4Z2BJ88_9TELE|nr:hypothetical protein fugu_019357 [Takifugu bimaculatus]